MKSDYRQSFLSRKVLIISVSLVFLFGLIFFILTHTSSTSIIQKIFEQEVMTEEHLEKHLSAVEEASYEKFNALLEKTKLCNDIMSDALKEIAELKSSRSSLECLKSNLLVGSNEKAIKPELIDNSGASAYLQSFHQSFGPNDPMKVNPNNISTVTLWWEAAAMIAWYMNPPQNTAKRHPCKNMVNFGNWPVCQDEQFVVNQPCLVYSFGIANDFSFDDHAGRMGCKVHSFDPSMNKTDHVRNENVTFYNMGIAAYDTNGWEPYKDAYITHKQIWKVRTLKSIMSELNHANRNLDILKIDVESTEWTVLNNIVETDMLKNIRIFLIEYHLFPTRPFKEDYVNFLKSMTYLRELGFREFFYEPCCLRTSNPNDFNYQAHVGYVNFNF
ncbi:Methyltransferase-like protein 24 [Bulinus truncatus]|nr:Methyltransferase-like protein 24 [Bulinus truncatus]